jgi:transcriptional/translational regulatory protein YebC/TACO1
METALDAGADDVITDNDGAIEVLCEPNDFQSVKSALEKSGLKPEVAEVTMRATTETQLIGDDGAKMQKLLDAIESLDDVQEVYTNAVIQ